MSLERWFPWRFTGRLVLENLVMAVIFSVRARSDVGKELVVCRGMRVGNSHCLGPGRGLYIRCLILLRMVSLSRTSMIPLIVQTSDEAVLFPICVAPSLHVKSLTFFHPVTQQLAIPSVNCRETDTDVKLHID